MTKHTVKLLPSGEEIQVEEGQTLMQVLREQGHYIKSSCGGVASCSDCIVKIVAGVDNINSPSFPEVQLLGNVFHITKERLSCQLTVEGDVTLDISAHDQKKDEERMREKSQQARKTIVKKRDQIQAEKQKREEEPEKPWHKHWEKKGEDNRNFRPIGGNRRPKEFRYSKDDEEES